MSTPARTCTFLLIQVESSHKSKSGFMEDFCDGKLFSVHPLFSVHCNFDTTSSTDSVILLSLLKQTVHSYVHMKQRFHLSKNGIVPKPRLQGAQQRDVYQAVLFHHTPSLQSPSFPNSLLTKRYTHRFLIKRKPINWTYVCNKLEVVVELSE